MDKKATERKILKTIRFSEIGDEFLDLEAFKRMEGFNTILLDFRVYGLGFQFRVSHRMTCS